MSERVYTPMIQKLTPRPQVLQHSGGQGGGAPHTAVGGHTLSSASTLTRRKWSVLHVCATASVMESHKLRASLYLLDSSASASAPMHTGTLFDLCASAVHWMGGCTPRGGGRCSTNR